MGSYLMHYRISSSSGTWHRTPATYRPAPFQQARLAPHGRHLSRSLTCASRHQHPPPQRPASLGARAPAASPAAAPPAARARSAAPPRHLSHRVRAAPEEPCEPEGAQTGGTTLQQLQEVIKEVLGAQYCLKPSAVTPSEIKQLPSLALVKARVEGLRDEFGAEAAAQLLHSHLDILRAGPATGVRERLGVVAAACGCDVAAALQLCTCHKGMARLLTRTPKALELAFAAVRECVGLQSRQDLHKVFSRVARILTIPSGLLRERHAALGTLLGLDSVALAQLLSHCPSLLAVSPAKVQAGVEAVKDGLELGSWEEAVQVATRSSVLLAYNPQRIVEVLRWLKHRMEMSPAELARYTILLGKSTALLEERLQALPCALGIPPAEALLLAKAAPLVLMMPAATAGKAWAEVKLAVGLQPIWRAQLLAGSARSLSMCLN